MDDLFPAETNRYRLLVDKTEAFALFMLDLDGRVRVWNPGAERLFGWTASEIIGRDSLVLWVPEDRAVRADLNEMQTSEIAGEAPDERWHLRKDGSRVWVQGATTAVHDDDGRLVAYAKVGRDATMRQHTFEALQQSEGEIRRTLDEVSDLNAGLHRDLEAERAEVDRLADALAETSVREQQRLAAVLHDDIQQFLIGAAMRVKVLRSTAGTEEGVSHLNDLARVLDDAFESTRTLTSRLVPPDVLTAPLQASLGWLASHVEEVHGLHVLLDVADVDGTPPIQGNVRLVLFKAVRELLFNVVKHAGTLEAMVSARTTETAVTVVVEDRGTGVAEDAEPGYGLADVRKRLGAVGGTLEVRPAPVEGTRAVVRVPRHT